MSSLPDSAALPKDALCRAVLRANSQPILYLEERRIALLINVLASEGEVSNQGYSVNERSVEIIHGAARAWFDHWEDLSALVSLNPTWWSSISLRFLATHARLLFNRCEGFYWKVTNPKSGVEHWFVGTVHSWCNGMMENPHLATLLRSSDHFFFENSNVRGGGSSTIDGCIYQAVGCFGKQRHFLERSARTTAETVKNVAFEEVMAVSILRAWASGDITQFDCWCGSDPSLINGRNVRWCLATMEGAGLLRCLFEAPKSCCVVAGCRHFFCGGPYSLVSLFGRAGFIVERLPRAWS